MKTQEIPAEKLLNIIEEKDCKIAELEQKIQWFMEQISAQSVTVIGKGDKERKIYLTPAAKNTVNVWLNERNNYHPQDNALFISNRGVRITTQAIQIVIKNAVEAAVLSQTRNSFD